MADCLQPYHHELLTDNALALAYEQLIEIFGRYEIAATFAYVMAFVLNSEERDRFRPQLLGDVHDEWLRAYREATSSRRMSGWHQPAALEIVRAANIHEIACHGFCHRPLAETTTSLSDANAELDAAIEVARLKGLSLETFVFPRNQVGHLELLRSHGFIGYRQSLRRPGGIVGRAVSLAEEFNVWALPQLAAPVTDGLVPIPSGHFLNWRFGLRTRVPVATTAARWRHQLRRARRSGGVVHLWLHPHNLITGPSTAALLDSVLAEVVQMRDRGQVRVLTQRDFCREELARSGLAKVA